MVVLLLPEGVKPKPSHEAPAQPTLPQEPASEPSPASTRPSGPSQPAVSEAPVAVAPNNLLAPGDQRTRRSCIYCRDECYDCDAVTMNVAKSKDYRWECSNCAERRHAEGNPDLECLFPRKLERHDRTTYRRYARDDPPHWNNPATGQPTKCDLCAHTGKHCDVDSVLLVGCQNCWSEDKKVRDGDSSQFRNKSCTVRGRLMKNKHPKLRSGVDPWSRHECNHCEGLCRNRRDVPVEQMCSWLTDRNSWGYPCQQCQVAGRSCLRNGKQVLMPGKSHQGPQGGQKGCSKTVVPAPIPLDKKLTSWDPKDPDNRGMTSEVWKITAWRNMCQRCSRDKSHCYTWVNRPDHACKRCTMLGLDCYAFTPVPGTQGREHYRHSWPIDSVGTVGFGANSMPYPRCSQCHGHGRNCDRQRPCDSCVNRDIECDEFVTGRNLINGRLGEETWSDTPGHLYYLALGYDAQGVHTSKYGDQLEHWIGPIAATYAYPYEMDDRGVVKRPALRLAYVGKKGRSELKPPGRPPHERHTRPCMVQHELDEKHHNALPSTWTLEDIRDRIRAAWQSGSPCVPPRQYGCFLEISLDMKINYRHAIGEADSETGQKAVAGLKPLSRPAPPRPQVAQQHTTRVGTLGATDKKQAPASVRTQQPHAVNACPRTQAIDLTSDQADTAGPSAAQTPDAVSSGHAAGTLPPSDQVPNSSHTTNSTEESSLFVGDSNDLAGRESHAPSNITHEKLPPGQHQASFHALDLDISQLLPEGAPETQGQRPKKTFSPVISGMAGQMYDPLADTDALFYVPSENPRPKTNDKQIYQCAGKVTVNRSGNDTQGSCANKVTQGNNKCGHLECRWCICTEHDEESKKELINQKQPLTTPARIVAMRAYACQGCTMSLIQGTAQRAKKGTPGVLMLPNLWTNVPIKAKENQAIHVLNADISIKPYLSGATGCACAAKLFNVRLCSKDRQSLAAEANDRVLSTLQTLIRTGHGETCSLCPYVNFEAAAADYLTPSGINAWICMQCRDWVLWQGAEPQKLVPGWEKWFHDAPLEWAKFTAPATGTHCGYRRSTPAARPQVKRKAARNNTSNSAPSSKRARYIAPSSSTVHNAVESTGTSPSGSQAKVQPSAEHGVTRPLPTPVPNDTRKRGRGSDETTLINEQGGQAKRLRGRNPS